MLRILRMTVLLCLMLAGLSLPASAQTTSKTEGLLFNVTLLNDLSSCKNYSLLVQDMSSGKQLFSEVGKGPLSREEILTKANKVPNFDRNKALINEEQMPCDPGGTVYSEPNSGNPAGNPDEVMRQHTLKVAEAARLAYLNSMGAQLKGIQAKPINRPTVTPRTGDKALAPIHNPATRNPAVREPRP